MASSEKEVKREAQNGNDRSEKEVKREAQNGSERSEKEAKREAQVRRLYLRVGSLCLPVCAGLFFASQQQLAVCALAAVFWSLLEIAIFHSAKLACCWKVPFGIRITVAVCLDAIICTRMGRNRTVNTALHTLSVVLPCANETDFVMNTTRSIFAATPKEQLREIIIVDDGSVPLISEVINKDELEALRGRIIRHDVAEGLIRSKKHGADSASGDIIVFLDCHVKPIEGWTEDFFSEIQENPKRIVVPTISALDPDTWEEISTSGGTKMCLSWNADMYWCNGYPGKYVPIMSGGLLALSRYWWQTTGGYDDEMWVWGGENLDQSLRTWLCGGEIVVADRSRVAHMWRDPNKPKTMLQYAIPTEHVRRNRIRAATSWMGDWARKVETFPEFEEFAEGGPLHVGSLDNVQKYQRSLQCKTFDWYLNRFKDLYVPTGALPRSVFNIQDKMSQLCIHHELDYGSSHGGRMTLRPCNRHSEAQRWHEANKRPDGMCCSGLKLWDIDVCLTVADSQDKIESMPCMSHGEYSTQYMKLSENGLLQWEDGKRCITPTWEQEIGPDSLQKQKAKLYPNLGCSAQIQEISDDGEQLLRVVAGEKCMSVGQGEHWQEMGMPLVFMPCDSDDHKQIFAFGHDEYPDGSRTIVDINGMCIDAASGGENGPLSYPCHEMSANSRQQRFIGSIGSTISWIGLTDEMGYSCIDPVPDMDNVISLAICAETSDGVSKSGQQFVKHDIQSDGSFQLQEPTLAKCLVPTNQGMGMVLTGVECDTSSQQRWVQFGKALKHIDEALCLDSYDGKTPLLFQCTEDSTNQVFKLHDNGWVEKPRSFADNGRVRYLSKCLDLEPVEPANLRISDCKIAAESATSWERIWEETPLETQLFIDAAKRQGFSSSFDTK